MEGQVCECPTEVARRSLTKWSLASLLDQNPLVSMAEVNGLLVDLLDMPREVQQIAFDKGMISYIPADHEKGPE